MIVVVWFERCRGGISGLESPGGRGGSDRRCLGRELVVFVGCGVVLNWAIISLWFCGVKRSKV